MFSSHAHVSFRTRRQWSLGLLLSVLLSLGLSAFAQAQLPHGEILVGDVAAGLTSRGILFRVSPTTGARTVLSDFGVGANAGVDPRGVAVEADGQILVVDSVAGTNLQGALFRVNPTTGARTLLSDFGVGANLGGDPFGVAVEADGQILVVDLSAGTNVAGALFRIDPTTGARTLLSDFGAGANQGFEPRGVAVEADGQILVADFAVGTNGQGALFRIDPTTGVRTVLSDFGAGANPGVDPIGVTVEANGQILVVDFSAGTNGRGALFRVDPVTGARTLLSDLGVGANLGLQPIDVEVEADGQILVVDPEAGTDNRGALFRVDPVTGARTLLHDFGLGTNPGVNPVSVAVVPPTANQAPLARCQNVTVDATVTSCSFPASINNGSSDPDSGDTITLSQSPAGPYGLGTTSVTLTVTDSHNIHSTCTGTVTVRDTIPPPLSCPAPITAECVNSRATVTFATPQPDPDNCGLSRSTGCFPPSGSGFPLGNTSVRCSATDTRNTASCSFNINVVDTIAPSITCPGSQTVEATSVAGVSVSFATPTASDACTTPSVSCDATSGSTFPLGSSTVNCTASDGPNRNTCSFNITVRDTTAPTLTCPANVVVGISQPITLGTPTVSDVIDTTPTVSNNAPASYPIGFTTVTWTAQDAAGNTSSCQQTVQVTYAFTGFFQPVDNPNVVNVVKAGQAIPVKFSLGGNYGLNIFATGSPTSQQVACTNGAPLDDVEETVTAGNSTLTYDAGTTQYHYVWKTDKSWSGQCRQLTVTLSDGTSRTANFQFK